jgi:hypothetical protein
MQMDPFSHRIATAPTGGNHTVFVRGPFGSGKSEALGQRLRYLLASGVPGYSILMLLPDRSASLRYEQLVAGMDSGPYGSVDLFTYYGLASRLVRLFWPLIAAEAGFAEPAKPPVMLNYESAQYLMGQVVAPRLAEGYFEGLALRPQRILSQLLDNLNKAAVNGFPLAEIAPRLKEAWGGEESRLLYYDQIQECVQAFKDHCLQHGVLDFSLVVEVFQGHLVEKAEFWRYFTERFRHVLVDRLEESTPVAQDLVRRLLPVCDSATLVCDPDAGFRVFLGVDGQASQTLASYCHQVVDAPAPVGQSDDILAFRAGVGRRLGQDTPRPPTGRAAGAVASLIQTRYRAQMLEKVAEEIISLVEKGVPPGQIAVVAPYADGVLRFSLGEALGRADVPFAVMRRFESLREEPIVRACLTLTALAHPSWDIKPPPHDVAEAMALALTPLDRVRAALIGRHLYNPRAGLLRQRDELGAVEQERIGFAALERFERLEQWVAAYRDGGEAPFDHFLRRLFGEVLANPQLNPEDAAVYSKLIASASGFRQAAPALGTDEAGAGGRYVRMVMEGVVAAQHLSGSDVEAAAESLVLVAPVYTYLLSRQTARYHFWLDVGSLNWWQPPHQPLTNHHVLSRRWKRGERWTENTDFAVRNRVLFRLVDGLSRRCSDKIYLCTCEVETSGEVLDSPLIRSVQQVLQEQGA